MTNTLTTVGQAHAAQRRAPSPGAILAIVLTGQFMALLDASVVNVAAPAIHAGLHASGAGLQLVIAGYVITYAVLLVTGARLGDIIGHRTMFLAGVALFTLASLGCGLAGSTSVLVTLRFVQGAGAAAMIPQVLSLIQRSFPGPARARPMRLYAAVLAGGAVAGQVVGGLLVSADLWGSSWRPVFLLNVPVGAVLLITGSRLLPRGRGGRGRAGLGLGVPGGQRAGLRRVRHGRAAAGDGGRLAADPRPGAAAAGRGHGHRRAVRGPGRVRRLLLHAGPAPAGRAG